MHRRQDTSRVTGMNTSQLNMLHNSRYKGMCTIADGICLTFCSMIQETVNQDWSVRRHTNCSCHIAGHALIIIDNFHTAAAKNIGRTYHNRVTNLIGDLQCFINGCCHAGFRHRNVKFFHHGTEQVTIFCKINDCRCCTKNLYAVFLKLCCQIQWCLTAKLCNHAQWFFFLINAENIFQCQRLKIKLVRCVIIGRNSFRITIDNNSLKTKLL